MQSLSQSVLYNGEGWTLFGNNFFGNFFSNLLLYLFRIIIELIDESPVYCIIDNLEYLKSIRLLFAKFLFDKGVVSTFVHIEFLQLVSAFAQELDINFHQVRVHFIAPIKFEVREDIGVLFKQNLWDDQVFEDPVLN